ncbi:MAG: hypothetical protein AB2598_16860 [Candidatus Thiodiazotropha sp.]
MLNRRGTSLVEQPNLQADVTLARYVFGDSPLGVNGGELIRPAPITALTRTMNSGVMQGV